MKLALNPFSSAVGLTFFLACAGCGSSSDLSDHSASIVGTVTNAAIQPLTVSVDGTSLSTATDSSGRFVLHGLREGRAVLHFRGRGIDVRVEISGLVAGQTLRITVQISGSRAVVSRSPNHIELSGAIASISAPNLSISGLTLTTTARTELKRLGRRIAFADLQVGQFVKVQGSMGTNGTVVARKIELLTVAGVNQVKIRGLIDSINPPNLVVLGLSVAADAATHLNGRSLVDLRVGDAVQVEGMLRADGTILAQSIKRIDRDEDEDEDD